MIFNKYLHIRAPKLSAYLDAQISTTQSRRIEAHLATCRFCTARLDDLRAIQSSLQTIKTRVLWDTPLPPWSLIERELVSTRVRASFFARYGFHVAGAGGAALLLILAVYHYLPISTPPGEPSAITSESSDLYQYVGDRLFAPEKVLLGDAVAIRPELEEAVLPQNVYFHDRSPL
jgi:hypothetical protein